MTDRIPLDHLTSDDLDQLYEQLDRAQRVAMRALDDEPTPSRRSGLRDEIAAALEAADYRMDMQRGDLADSVMPVLYREWPWLRAEAEHAATGPRILCATTRPGHHTTICDLPAGHGDHDGATGYGERVSWPAAAEATGPDCSRTTPDNLREQLAAAISPVLHENPEHNTYDQHDQAVAELLDAVLAVVLPPDGQTGCRCHNIDELCSGCRRCPDICQGCDGPQRQTKEQP